MVTGEFVLARREGAALLVEIDRPDKRNALSLALVEELEAVLREARHEPAILVIGSRTPGMFIAGADIAELLARGEEEAFRAWNVELFDRIASWRWPAIAAIDGPALGGGLELALACDFRIASERARFGQPELGLGILAGAGGNWRLPEVVGLQWARRMLLLGAQLDARQALDAGLVDEVVEDPLATALARAEEIASRPWRALELTKLALASGQRPSTRAIDVLGQAILFESSEKERRMQAFLSRRSR